MTRVNNWEIILTRHAEKSFSKLDKQAQQDIHNFLHDRLQPNPNPRFTGKALVGTLKGFWRYRVGDYRILCKINDAELIIVAVEIGHRSKIYD